MQEKAKPIFEEEKRFIEEKLNISLPEDCWIVGGGTKYIYLDIYSDVPFIKFKVHNDGTFELIRNNSEKLKDYKRLTINETIAKEKERLQQDWDRDVERTAKFVSEHRDIPYNISISGGKDSEVLYNLWKEMLSKLDFIPDYEFIFFNTSNEVADVYKYIKAQKDIRIINPEVGWYQTIIKKKAIPSTFRRFCCSTYKEGQVKKIFDSSSPRCQVIGMRKRESNKRAGYAFYMDYDFDVKLRGTSLQPKLWSKLCPIIDWTTTDVWILMIYKGFFINQKYKNGWSRVGCAICPFSNSYEDELTRIFYPQIWNRFSKIVTEFYHTKNYDRLLGYSEQEYVNGIWKTPINKDVEFLRNKPTPKNIHKFAEYKGLSDEMAAKFWNNKCEKCGKKLAPIEIGMFYRIYGRKEGEEDNRQGICGKCFCKENNITKKEYYEMAVNFKETGCNLF